MISNYLDLIVSFNNLSTKFLKYKLVETDGTVVNFGRIRYKGGKTTWTSFDRVYLDFQNDVHNVHNSLFFIRKGLIKNINMHFDNNSDNDPIFIYYITRIDKNDYHFLLDYK